MSFKRIYYQLVGRGRLIQAEYALTTWLQTEGIKVATAEKYIIKIVANTIAYLPVNTRVKGA